MSSEQPSPSGSGLMKCEECNQDIWYLSEREFEELNELLKEDGDEAIRALCESCEPEPTEEEKEEFLKEMCELHK